MWWKRCVVAAALVLAGTGVPIGTRAAEESLEYAIKAAYLYKFGAFVEWPEAAFPSPTSPTVLCVVGEDPFGPTLDKAVVTQRIADRTIEVRRLQTVAPNSGCQILFVDGGDGPRISKTLAAVRGTNVLTVTDNAPSPDATGIINFVLDNKRVRFEIDDEQASVNGLTISSKLLDLARSAKRRG